MDLMNDISDDEDDSIAVSTKTNDTIIRSEKQTSVFLCPIKSCTFSMLSDDDNLKRVHTETKHPDLKVSVVSFLKL